MMLALYLEIHVPGSVLDNGKTKTGKRHSHLQAAGAPAAQTRASTGVVVRDTCREETSEPARRRDIQPAW